MKVRTAIKENNGEKLACKEGMALSCHSELDNLSLRGLCKYQGSQNVSKLEIDIRYLVSHGRKIVSLRIEFVLTLELK